MSCWASLVAKVPCGSRGSRFPERIVLTYLARRTMDHRAAEAYILAKLREELPPDRTYHSVEHTLDVCESASAIAEQEGVSGEGLVLLRTAALYHDSGYLVGAAGHEDASCLIARETLPGFGFSPGQVDRICSLVQATRVPQVPQDELGRILCDADLDYLGRDDFALVGGRLFREMVAYGLLGTEREWNELQVRFLEGHRYFTRTNLRLREPVKERHFAALKLWLANP